MENLESNISKENYQDPLIKQGFQKALLIPQKDLQKLKNLSNKNIHYHSLQHLIQVTLIYIALLNPWLIV